MTRIAVIGGTGYAGGHIVRTAADRGHEVISYSRTLPETPAPGVEYREADFTDAEAARAIVADADVVIVCAAPRGDMEGRVEGAVAQLAALAAEAGVRLGVIGGAGSLLVSEGGPRVMDGPDFPAAILPEAQEAGRMLDALRADDSGLDWFYVSPAAGFGSFAPGEPRGTYRVGGDVLLVDEAGESFVSGADFATALVDEIQEPAHRRQRFTVAY
ncbi:NAD(P)-dependent oxidoreductase [Microbacterium sediminis]|uniref:NAD-dependent epimerase n=1 Tax=Microbacterium sediminis TaxID=904291 RepID=A0A1B9NIV9_9MICO|nr:NAD(P)H-binding protein [Microbacterium sediminis]OCG76542.1 NAD-dependent epimerase [Microbacterium sediminis]QBR73853.1 NAD-dependent epimerase/dehydratase family protein [Microbacterium sediminis]